MKPLSHAAAPSGAVPTTAPSIEALDLMPVNDKMAFFARRDAFWLPKQDGQRLASARRFSRDGLPKRLTPGSMHVVDGHVTRQAYEVIGRPCFGIPTARLVHGREYIIRDRGRPALARCGECPIRQACHFVCDERLHANEDIREAYRDFQRYCGREAFWSPDVADRKAVGLALSKLLRHLQAANFTTVADASIEAHYDKKAFQKREAAAERQRQHRAQVQQAPSASDPIPSDQIIKGEARLLRDKLCAVKKQANCPRMLRQMDEDLLERVWPVRMKLSLLRKPHGPTAIARALAKLYPDDTLDALRKRIEIVLKRVPLLESTPKNSSKGVVGG